MLFRHAGISGVRLHGRVAEAPRRSKAPEVLRGRRSMAVKGTRFHVLVAVVVALFVGAWPATVGANHPWDGFHWTREANPLTVRVGDNLDSTWVSYLTTAVSDWSQQPKLLVVTVQPGQAPSPDCDPPVAGTTQVC